MVDNIYPPLDMSGNPEAGLLPDTSDATSQTAKLLRRLAGLDPIFPQTVTPGEAQLRGGAGLAGVGMAEMGLMPGEDRMQWWPEKMVRSGVSLPGDVASGKVPMWAADPTTGEVHTAPEVIERAQDTAGLAGGGSIAATNAGKIAAQAPRLLEDAATVGAPVAGAGHAQPFYSGLASAVDSIPQSKMPGIQWINTIANKPGVKPEELDWTGLRQYLDQNKGRAVTKAEVQEHLTANPVTLNEVVKRDKIGVEPLNVPEMERLEELRGIRMGDRDFTPAERQEYQQLTIRNNGGEPPPGGEAKYSGYQLPGGENYREMLMTLPVGEGSKPYEALRAQADALRTRKLGDVLDDGRTVQQTLDDIYARQSALKENSYRSSHWDEPNVLLHMRMNDRVMPDQGFTVMNRSGNKGPNFPSQDAALAYMESLPENVRRNVRIEPTPIPKKTLHVEEIQSDWHQQGRDRGYHGENEALRRDLGAERDRLIRDDPQNFDAINDLHDRIDNIPGVDEGAVPNAPFKKNWHEVAIKRAIKEAADNGYDRVSWTPGDAQAARYDLSKQISRIHLRDEVSGMGKPDMAGEFKSGTLQAYDHNGRRIIDEHVESPQRLREVIGKEAADKLLQSEAKEGSYAGLRSRERKLEGLDLKVGGEGMRGFYDDILPKAVQKITKQYGVKAQQGDIAGKFEAVLGNKVHAEFPDKASADRWASRMNQGMRPENRYEIKENRQPVWYFDIPEAMRNDVKSKGFSLFEDATPASAAIGGLAHSQQYANLLDKSPYDLGAPNVAPSAAESAATAGAGAQSGGRSGTGGGNRSLEQAQAEAARIAGPDAPLEGLPQKPIILNGDYYVPGPIGSIRDIAKQYVESTGRAYNPPTKYHPIDPEHSKAIAQAFDEMKHAPDDPAVKASYDALIDETLAQYRAMKEAGVKIEPIPADMPDPYGANPRLAAKDVADNNHLWFFSTDQGFGSSGPAGANHPMLRKTGEKIGDHEMLANDVFRVVHDYFGHLKEGHGFRAAGEDNAYRAHSAMYSDLARPAMTTETRGQNSWVNYGPHGERNRTANAADTIYADQKVGLMPEWTMRDRGSPEPIVAYHGSPHDFDRFSMDAIGKGEGNQAYGHGLYFTENEKVARGYRHQLSAMQDEKVLKKHGLDTEDGPFIGRFLAARDGDVQAAIGDVKRMREEAMQSSDTSLAQKNYVKRLQGIENYLADESSKKGRSYQVALDINPEHLLDYHKPMSQQSAYVQERLAPMVRDREANAKEFRQRKLEEELAKPRPNPRLIERYRQPIVPTADLQGQRLYEMAGGPALNPTEGAPQSSQRLLEMGIPGLRYNGDVRFGGNGQPSKNLVVFDDATIRLLKKYALIGSAGLGMSLFPPREEQ